MTLFILWLLVYQGKLPRTFKVLLLFPWKISLFWQIVSFPLKFITFSGYPFLEYMIKKLGIEEEKVPELCVSLYKCYGTTMAGLKVKAIIPFVWIWSSFENVWTIERWQIFFSSRLLATTLIMMIFMGTDVSPILVLSVDFIYGMWF